MNAKIIIFPDYWIVFITPISYEHHILQQHIQLKFNDIKINNAAMIKDFIKKLAFSKKIDYTCGFNTKN